VQGVQQNQRKVRLGDDIPNQAPTRRKVQGVRFELTNSYETRTST
jgi:hypothetical protein